MAVDAIVRIGFEGVTKANQGANKALVGVAQGDTGPGPFRKVSTAAYSCAGASDVDVATAIATLGGVIAQYSADLDFVSISIVKHKTP